MNLQRLVTRPWFPFLAFLAAIIVVDIGKDVVALSLRGMPVSPRMFREQFLWWCSWLVLLPFVLGAAQRTRPDRLGWVWTASSQFLAGLVFVTAHAAMSAAAFVMLPPYWEPALWSTRFIGLTDAYFVSSFGVYSASVVTFLVWTYHERLRDRELEAADAEIRAARLEMLMRDARMDALRKELNPHFLHNALQSVSGLVRAGESQRAVRMLASLGTHLRTLLAGDASASIPLSDEVELLERYLEIESVRFEERLRVAFDIAPDAAAEPVPPLLLQPLVENAIRHGVARTTRPVTIEVSGRIRGGRLVLTVADDGPGGGPDASGSATGVGLDNTRERLRHAFGPGATLTVGPRGTRGYRARIDLPASGVRATPGRAV